MRLTELSAGTVVGTSCRHSGLWRPQGTAVPDGDLAFIDSGVLARGDSPPLQRPSCIAVVVPVKRHSSSAASARHRASRGDVVYSCGGLSLIARSTAETSRSVSTLPGAELWGCLRPANRWPLSRSGVQVRLPGPLRASDIVRGPAIRALAHPTAPAMRHTNRPFTGLSGGSPCGLCRGAKASPSEVTPAHRPMALRAAAVDRRGAHGLHLRMPRFTVGRTQARGARADLE